MLVFLKIAFIVYVIAINAYAFILVKTKRDEEEEVRECSENFRPSSGKLFITAFLGGSLGVYVAMFVFKYRLTSLLLMVFIPVLIALNGYIAYLLFAQNFGMIVQTAFISKSVLKKTFLFQT